MKIQLKCLSFKISLIKATPHWGLQVQVIKGTRTKGSFFKCTLRRDIITWDLDHKDLVINGQAK